MTPPRDPPNPPPKLAPNDHVQATPSQARILRELVQELKAETAPDLDWDRVERGLLDRLDEETGAPSDAALSEVASAHPAHEAAQPKPNRAQGKSALKGTSSLKGTLALPLPPTTEAEPSSTPWRVAHWHLAVAAAAVLLVAFGTLWRMDVAGPARTAQQRGAERFDGEGLDRPSGGDLTRLRAGDVVEASDGPIVYEAPGVVRWTLAAGGRLAVKHAVDAPGHVLALERGSVRAEVNPAASRIHRASGDAVERFAIEVGGTRVAVRGTVFTVTRTTAGMVVSVERGTVAVGRIGSSGLTEGRLLVAPARQSFEMDGALSGSWGGSDGSRSLLDAQDGSHPPQAEGSANGTSLDEGSAGPVRRGPAMLPGGRGLPLASEGAHEAPVVGAAAGEPRLLTSASIRAGLLQCFDRTYRASSPMVGFSVSSTLHVTVDDQGGVTAARFVPPVRAELARCAGSVISGHFGTGPDQVSVSIEYAVGGSTRP